MSHKVRVLKAAVLSKDGRPLKGKYRYTAKCQCCGMLSDKPVTSAVEAQGLKDSHHFDASIRHQLRHPGDKAHVRTHTRKEKKLVTARG